MSHVRLNTGGVKRFIVSKVFEIVWVIFEVSLQMPKVLSSLLFVTERSQAYLQLI